MKTYVEIKNEMNATREAVAQAQAEIDAILEGRHNLYESDKNAYKEYKLWGESKADMDKMCQLNQNVEDYKLMLKILDNNARRALFNEVLPVALEILGKYDGKAYGMKTRKKISDEMYARTGCRMHIGENPYSYYSLHINRDDGLYDPDYRLECNKILADNRISGFLTDDNKVDISNSDNIKLWEVDEYVEDVHKRVAELKEAQARFVKAKEELKELAREFNDLAVGRIERMQVI